MEKFINDATSKVMFRGCIFLAKPEGRVQKEKEPDRFKLLGPFFFFEEMISWLISEQTELFITRLKLESPVLALENWELVCFIFVSAFFNCM